MSGTWELLALTALPQTQRKKKEKMKACIESQLYTVQVESERWTLIACMEILLLKLAATIFGLD